MQASGALFGFSREETRHQKCGAIKWTGCNSGCQRRGAWDDVDASAGEFHLLQHRFGGDGLEIDIGLGGDRGTHGDEVVGTVHLDAVAGIEEDHPVARLRPLAQRLKGGPDVGAGGHDKISTGKSDAKFGVSTEQALALFARAADDPHLHAQGLAVHIGSQIRDLAPLEAAFRVMRSLAEKLRSEGIAIERLDLGGGLGVPYFNEPDPPSPAEYAAMVARVFDGFDIGLSFEPGRMIAANAGVLLSRVVRLQERPRPIVVLDAAMNDLIRPAIYDAYHGIKPLKQATAAEQARPARASGASLGRSGRLGALASLVWRFWRASCLPASAASSTAPSSRV